MLWLAFFFIELGAGMFFVASFFDSLLAMFIGWLVCGVLGGGFHILFLGKPARFWRMVFSSGWQTSWISRGLSFVILFLILSQHKAVYRLQDLYVSGLQSLGTLLDVELDLLPLVQ